MFPQFRNVLVEGIFCVFPYFYFDKQCLRIIRDRKETRLYTLFNDIVIHEVIGIYSLTHGQGNVLCLKECSAIVCINSGI